MQIVQCEESRHAEAIRAIFNEAILNSTALYDYQPRSREMMATWFETKRKTGFPVIGIENEAGELMAFGSYGTFRAFPAYKYTAEHSVYVEVNHRGRGLGKLVLQELIAAAQAQQLHVLMGCIDATNAASIRLHEGLGFVHCGTVRQAGFKFARWLDLAMYQLLLPTPAQPVDG